MKIKGILNITPHRLVGLLDPRNASTTLFRNVGVNLSLGTMQHSSKPHIFININVTASNLAQCTTMLSLFNDASSCEIVFINNELAGKKK
jgi:hypothetical protein